MDEKELIAAAKAAIIDECKVDIEQINALLAKNREGVAAEILQLKKELDVREIKMKNAAVPGGETKVGGYSAVSQEEKAFGEWLRKGDRAQETKVLLIGSDPSFGYACPAQLSGDILRALTEGNPMRGISKVYQTDKNSLEVLKKSASGAVVLQSGEVGEILETTGLAYSKLTFTPRTEVYLLKASLLNLEDSSFNMEEEISLELGEAFGTYEAAAQITGAEGIIANVGDGTLNTYNHTHMGSATVIDPNKIVGLTYAIPTRFLSGARFLMNRVTMGLVRGLKDPVSGAFMFQSLLTGADRDTLCGFPITLVDNFPAATSALYPIAFGNWSKAFGIVDRYPGFTVQRMAEAFAIYGIVGFLARFRTTHGPLVGEAAHFLQMSV